MGHYKPSIEEKSEFAGTEPIEKVVQNLQGVGSIPPARLVRKRYPSKQYQSWVVERFIDSVWVRSKNGPWDYLGNARDDLYNRLPRVK